jgi:hypothetical protein
MVTKRIDVVMMIAVTVLASVAVFFAQRTVATGSKGTAATQPAFQLARMSDEISVHAAGRGDPWINLSDGHELITPYSGPVELIEILERNEARPLSLCSADFDEDGVPDLISGYAGPNGGIITLLRGNVDSIYPNAPEAHQRKAEGAFTDAPFLSPAFVFSVAGAADFIGAGDFDGDGHSDVVAAARGGDNLHLLSGDGKGGLRETKRIDLSGGLTAMVVGEINRRDGLDDIVVGVSGGQGPKVLVFEGPEGALRARPEEFPVPKEVKSMALGQLDSEYTYDLVLASGKDLLIVHGRDRKLSLDKERQAEVTAAKVERREFNCEIRSLTVGNFTEGDEADIALLLGDGEVRLLRNPQTEGGVGHDAAVSRWHSELLTQNRGSESAHLVPVRTSSLPVDNLLIVDPQAERLEIVSSSCVEQELVLNARSDESEPRMLSASLEVQGNSPAVLPMRLNSDALSDLVVTMRGASRPASVMTVAAQTFTVTNTNDSGPGSLREAIIKANSNPGLDTILFNISSNSGASIRPLSPLPEVSGAATLDGTTQPGFAGKPIVELDGTNVQNSPGLWVTGGNSVVRSLVINRFGVSNSQPGLRVETNGGSVIEGNYFGTDINGVIPLANGFGIAAVHSSSNILGGTTINARNLISGNRQSGLILQDARATQNLVQGNLIGTNATGTADLGNELGPYIYGGSNNTIGGTAAGARNLISCNRVPGVAIFNTLEGTRAMGNLVQGNLIGTDIGGTIALRSPSTGVYINAASNTVGGTVGAARNIISGNDITGVAIFEANSLDNRVQGNFIGVDITGGRALGNTFGVVITQASSGNAIGGASITARNVISGNRGYGIGVGVLIPEVRDVGQTGSQVQGNYIGTDVTGVTGLGNGQDGVFVENNSLTNTIIENLIAFNKGNGVRIPDDPSSPIFPKNPAIQIGILSNLIHSNSLLGIDLGPVGPTANPFNRLTGANLLQNFPELASSVVSTSTATNGGVSPAATSVTITGVLTAKSITSYTLQFFFGNSCSSGQGHQFTGAIPVLLGSRAVTTDDGGVANYSITLPLPAAVTGVGYVNGTATDSVGNTSELSQCVQVTGTIPGAVPGIRSACKGEGKLLVINGSGFVDGAKVFINGDVEKKTQFVSSTQVIAFKAGKRTFTGDKLKVRNPDGTETPELTYTRADCPP